MADDQARRELLPKLLNRWTLPRGSHTNLLPGTACPVPTMTAGGVVTAGLSDRWKIMIGRILRYSISLAAVITSAGSLFAISWVGLALLGF